MMLDLNRIHERDCVAGMAEMDAESVDLAFADPPFNIGYEYDVYDDAKEAEHYYRAMYRGRPNTWNLRDTHMVDTLHQLMGHLERQGENPRAIVWAHNSHLGDARATQMGERGELNVGQLIREAHNDDALLVGFTTLVQGTWW